MYTGHASCQTGRRSAWAAGAFGMQAEHVPEAAGKGHSPQVRSTELDLSSLSARARVAVLLPCSLLQPHSKPQAATASTTHNALFRYSP